MRKSVEPWYCCVCAQFLQGAIKWGNMTGWIEISEKLDSMYQEIVCWKLNLFEVPKGKAGKDFIIELDRLLSAGPCSEFVGPGKRLFGPPAPISLPTFSSRGEGGTKGEGGCAGKQLRIERKRVVKHCTILPTVKPITYH